MSNFRGQVMFGRRFILAVLVAMVVMPALAWGQSIQLVPGTADACGGEQSVVVNLTSTANVSSFGFEVAFDTSQYEYVRTEKGADTATWVLVNGNVPANRPGVLIVGGARFTGAILNGDVEAAVLVFRSVCGGPNCESPLTLQNPSANTSTYALESATITCGPAVQEGEGEGTTEGSPEGSTEGSPEGTTEGSPEGTTEGSPEGTTEGSPEGTTEGSEDGEGQLVDEFPVAVCQDITVTLPSEGFVVIQPQALDGGSTDDRGAVTFTASKTTFLCSDLGPNTVTLRVRDSAGQVSTCTSTVTVVDDRVSSVVCKNFFTYVDVDGTVTVRPQDINNGSRDNCGIKSITISKSEFTCADLGRNSVELTVTDNNNNVESCTATVTVRDILFACVVIPSYTLTTNRDGQGVVTIETLPNADDGVSYQEGTRVTIKETPDTGWTFKEWTGDIGGASFGTNTITVPMTQNRAITAVFEESTTTPTGCNCNPTGKSNPFDNLGDIVMSLATLSALAMMAAAQRKFW
ncbi:MAG: hypothetical protein GC168_01270 [Candidatus Hydrogenedens sp.]|nr:hypothetical protein [Candidatus Hydrogenedens sp.]